MDYDQFWNDCCERNTDHHTPDQRRYGADTFCSVIHSIHEGSAAAKDAVFNNELADALRATDGYDLPKTMKQLWELDFGTLTTDQSKDVFFAAYDLADAAIAVTEKDDDHQVAANQFHIAAYTLQSALMPRHNGNA